ncbi:MAG: hypothetical protein Ct9H300mP28_11780 [Pseudomonadota bacterium]|nr:MAG: hypothetical protein Ct9H300mP28_11780 [Pseudomonadota bacterium]
MTKEEKDVSVWGQSLHSTDMTRIIVGLLDPVMPKKMCEARKILGLEKRFSHFPACLQDIGTWYGASKTKSIVPKDAGSSC